MTAKHYKTQPELKREHEKKPKESGCIWKHYIPKGDWQSHPCHYQNNSFKVSKGARTAKYKPDPAKVEKVRGNQDALKQQYEEAIKAHQQAAEKKLSDLSQQRSSAKASGETLPGRVHHRWYVTLKQVEAMRKTGPSALLSNSPREGAIISPKETGLRDFAEAAWGAAQGGWPEFQILR